MWCSMDLHDNQCTSHQLHSVMHHILVYRHCRTVDQRILHSKSFHSIGRIIETVPFDNHCPIHNQTVTILKINKITSPCNINVPRAISNFKIIINQICTTSKTRSCWICGWTINKVTIAKPGRIVWTYREDENTSAIPASHWTIDPLASLEMITLHTTYLLLEYIQCPIFARQQWDINFFD
jgi:hypothetical protein